MLAWSVQDCADMQGLLTEEERALSQALAYFSAVAGIDWRITEKNAGEWFARVSFYQALYGPIYQRVNEEGRVRGAKVTEEDIARRVGMYLGGCMKKETRRAFVVRVSARFMDAQEKGFSS